MAESGLLKRCLVLQVLVEDDLQHRGQQPHVTAWPDRQALEQLRGLGPPRIHDDDTATPISDVEHCLPHATLVHHAAVRDDRVGTEAQEEVRAREVRHRIGHVVAIQQLTHGPVVVDVHRGGAVKVLRLQCGGHPSSQKERAEVPGDGVACEHPDRLAPVAFDHGSQAPADVVQRLVPRHLLERPVRSAPKGVQDSIRIAAHRREGYPLRTCEPPRVRVIRIRLELDDLVAGDGRDQPARRLADSAEQFLRDRGHRHSPFPPVTQVINVPRAPRELRQAYLARRRRLLRACCRGGRVY